MLYQESFGNINQLWAFQNITDITALTGFKSLIRTSRMLLGLPVGVQSKAVTRRSIFVTYCQASTGQTILYSGHDDVNAPYTEGVGFVLSPTSGQVTHRLEPGIIQDCHSKDWKSFFHPVPCTNQRGWRCKKVWLLYEATRSHRWGSQKRHDIVAWSRFQCQGIGSEIQVLRQSWESMALVKWVKIESSLPTFVHKLVIGGSVFPHKKAHKLTWVSPDNKTENQIDHICISSKFRR